MKHITLTITGRPYSKKNSRRHAPRRNGLTGKLYTASLPSANFEKFEADAVSQLKAVKAHFDSHIFVSYQFYKKGNSLLDIDNAICSINDVLQEAGIISNDKLVTAGTFEFVAGCSEWKTVVSIASVEQIRFKDLSPKAQKNYETK